MAQIEVVKSAVPANYPFVVQIKNTEHWGTHDSAVTLAAAQESAQALLDKYPKLPVRIQHCTGGISVVSLVPKWQRQSVRGEVPHRTALWTGAGDPPRYGSKVNIRLNGIGPGVVTGYAVQDGYLGVMVRANEATRPAWHKKSNPDNNPGLTFGIELLEAA